MTKQTAKEFYSKLENHFPEVQKLELLKGINLQEDGFENSEIMTKLAKQLTKFVKDREFNKAIKFMYLVEQAIEVADDTVTNYLYTDFLVTIMEQDKEQREYLKSYMGLRTKEHYKNLFKFYQERDN